MGKLFEADSEAPLQDGKIVIGGVAGAQEAAIGHDQRGGEIAGEVVEEKLARCLVVEPRPLRDGFDRLALLELGELHGQLEHARFRGQHLG